MDIFIGFRLPNPYGREDLAPTRSPTSCFYQTHVTILFQILFTLPNQGYLVLGFFPILSEKSRFGDRSDSGKSYIENLNIRRTK